jgi:hypothetical protein
MEKFATRGQETELVSAMVRQFPYGKVPAERAQHLIEHQDELATILLNALAATVTVITATFKSLLAACHQAWVNSDITEDHFPLLDDGTKGPVEEYCFGKTITGLEAERQLKKMGYKLIGMKRGMEYIAAHPDNQLDHPIIVLGAQWQFPIGNVYVPYFCRFNGKRYLYLIWIGYEFFSHCRFLVSRE